MAAATPPGPALPWANASAGSGSVSTPAYNETGESAQVACTLEELEMDMGARIEVRWEIVQEDETKTLKWWGATVDCIPSDPLPPEAERHKAQVYLLRYDAYEDFEAEERKVLFLSKKQLFDVEGDTSLKWRTEGEEYDGEDDSDDEGMDDEEEIAGFTLAELVQAGEAMEPEGNAPVLNVPMPNITPFQERLVAERLNNFIGGFLAHIQAKKDPGSIVTADDVKEYFKDKKPPQT